MEKVLKELSDSRDYDNSKIKQLKEILMLVLMQTRIASTVTLTLYITMTLLRIQLIESVMSKCELKLFQSTM